MYCYAALRIKRCTQSICPSVYVCLSVRVTAALASAVPELDSTPMNKLTDDMRSSFVFDGAVRFFPVCPSRAYDFLEIGKQ